MTSNSLVTAALRLLRIVRNPGQSASSVELTEGFMRLNEMLDNWSTERYNIFNIATAAYALTTTVSGYLIGPAQTFNAPRPLRIERAGIQVVNPNGSGIIRWPLEILNERQWDEIAVKIKTSPVPTKLYCDNAWPFATLNLCPVPVFTGTAPKLELSTWTQLTDFPDQTTDETFPPGYEVALVYNLAVLLAPQFEKAIPDDAMAVIVDKANTLKANIRALNQALEVENTKMMAWQAEQPGGDPAGGPVNALVTK